MSYVRNATTHSIIARNVRRVWGPWERVAGFIGRARVRPDEGLWFDRCWAVHTVGVRVPLDILFLDRDGRIVEIAAGVPPSRWAVTCAGAFSVVEFGAGAVAANRARVGDQIILSS